MPCTGRGSEFQALDLPGPTPRSRHSIYCHFCTIGGHHPGFHLGRPVRSRTWRTLANHHRRTNVRHLPRCIRGMADSLTPSSAWPVCRRCLRRRRCTYAGGVCQPARRAKRDWCQLRCRRRRGSSNRVRRKYLWHDYGAGFRVCLWDFGDCGCIPTLPLWRKGPRIEPDPGWYCRKRHLWRDDCTFDVHGSDDCPRANHLLADGHPGWGKLGSNRHGCSNSRRHTDAGGLAWPQAGYSCAWRPGRESRRHQRPATTNDGDCAVHSAHRRRSILCRSDWVRWSCGSAYCAHCRRPFECCAATCFCARRRATDWCWRYLRPHRHPLRGSADWHLYSSHRRAHLLLPASADVAKEPRSMSVHAHGVTVIKQGRTIVNDVSMHARSGEVTGLIGPNGAGKSTLLAALSGDIAVAAGRVEVGGNDVASSSAQELARTRAVMLQDVGVAFSFLVRDVVEMGRHPWGTSDKDPEIVDAALSTTGMTHLQDREVVTLSGGERARVAFARVLAQQTPVVFLDEPTAAMDVRFQEQTMGIVRGLAAQGVAVVVVLHDLQLAARYCDRVVCLKSGEVAATGPVEEVYSNDVLSGVYDWPISVSSMDGRVFVTPAEASSPVPPR